MVVGKMCRRKVREVKIGGQSGYGEVEANITERRRLKQTTFTHFFQYEYDPGETKDALVLHFEKSAT